MNVKYRLWISLKAFHLTCSSFSYICISFCVEAERASSTRRSITMSINSVICQSIIRRLVFNQPHSLIPVLWRYWGAGTFLCAIRRVYAAHFSCLFHSCSSRNIVLFLFFVTHLFFFSFFFGVVCQLGRRKSKLASMSHSSVNSFNETLSQRIGLRKKQ